MVEVSSITPTYVYVQSTQPSDTTAGKLWGNTSVSPTTLYIADGSTYNIVATSLTQVNADITALLKTASDNALNILFTEAKASLTAGTTANIKADTYTTSGGYLSTINAGATTANFNATNYDNNLKSNETGTLLYSATISATAKIGVQIKIGANNTTIFSISKDSHCTATTAYLYASAQSDGGAVGAFIASQAFSGNTATFASPQAVTANTWYWVLVDSAGGSYTISVNENPASFPYTSTNLNFTYGMDSAGTPANTWLNLQPSAGVVVTQRRQNSIIQTNAQTLSATPTYAMIVAHETTAGTGSVTYDISTNGGTNYQTAQTSYNKITLTNAGTSLIIKQNLNAGASAGSASATDWGVMYW